MSQNKLLPCVEIEPDRPAEASIVWLHGLGANGHDFEPVANMLAPVLPVPVRFILPHAPQMPVTINGGVSMPAWYDMLNLEHPRSVDWETVAQSEQAVEALLERERQRGIASDSLYLAGFSQGGAMALRVALKGESEVAGVLALSTYLLQKEEEAFGLASEKSLPVFMAHGKLDPVLPFVLAERSREQLEKIGCEVQWKDYPMPHSVCQEEIEHIALWLKEQLG